MDNVNYIYYYQHILLYKRCTMQVRSLVFDENFLKNAEDSFLNKFIYLKEPIPMYIRMVIMGFIPNFNNKRSEAFGDDKQFRKKAREERLISRKLSHIEAREYHNDLALDFIEKHPEFAPIIKEIKYINV